MTHATDPWKTFSTRRWKNYHSEDISILSEFAQTNTVPNTEQIIVRFLRDDRRLYDPVPRQWQLLRDFLSQSDKGLGSYLKDINASNEINDSALIDDRRRHSRCTRDFSKGCNGCHATSQSLKIPQLCEYLALKRRRTDRKAERRIIFLPNLTSAGALTLVATMARHSAVLLRDFLHRYLGREHTFGVSTTPVRFSLEFHIPYHAIRKTERPDPRKLRKSGVLPLKEYARDQGKNVVSYFEAQTSSISWGYDEWFWTEIFVVDTYFGSEENRHQYFSSRIKGNGTDPPLGGEGMMYTPRFDPREYFLLKLRWRTEQVVIEYNSLVGTFNERMEKYAEEIQGKFVDDENRHTQTLSEVIQTVQEFVDCIGGTITAWDRFRNTEISLFNDGSNKLAQESWSLHFFSIARNIAELQRLQRILIIKRDRFKTKLESFHTVSSLSQTEITIQQTTTAVNQGTDLKVLTQMTVYFAFPLLFTTAFFGMEFFKPPDPGWTFLGMLMGIGLLNFAIASCVKYLVVTQRSLLDVAQSFVCQLKDWLIFYLMLLVGQGQDY